MSIFRTVIHGHRIEIRRGEFGGEYVYVDGRPIARNYFAGWLPKTGHHFDITDESGIKRHVEVRCVERFGGLAGTSVILSVDGVHRCTVERVSGYALSGCCQHCGYDVQKLETVNGEIRCPECGRHTPAALLGKSG